MEIGPASAGTRLFLETIIEADKDLGFRLLDSPAQSNKRRILIKSHYSWEGETDGDLGEILISCTPIVPFADSLLGRTDTTLERCIKDLEQLIEPQYLEPPNTALRVDGLALGDKGYPLILLGSVSVKPMNRRLLRKANELREIIKNAEKPLITAVPGIFWITAGGDMMLGRGASEVLIKEGAQGLFGGTAEMILSSNLALANLEGVISDRGERIQKSFNFRFTSAVAPALKEAGFNALLHANNHVYDYGETAFLDSISILENLGIGALGAGVNIDAASDPFEMQCGETTVRVFGLASFPRESSGWDGVSAAATAEKAGMLHAAAGGAQIIKQRMSEFESTAINIIFFHGGAEWSPGPDSATRELYTGLINSGASLVIGSHPHTIQGFEWVEGKPVFWSLGNFVFPGMRHMPGGGEGLFIRLGYWEGKLLYLEPFVVTVGNPVTDIAPSEKLEVFYARSRQLRQLFNQSKGDGDFH